MESQPRVVLYARISEDHSGVSAGVNRQLDDGRHYAKQRGWTVVAEESDNSISALSGKVRPAYERVMAMARAGEVDYIVCWQSSRFWRNRAERAGAIEELAAARVGLMAVRGADFDLTTAQGRMLAGLLGEVDTAESEVKAERVRAAGAQRVAAGHAYTRPGYGWTTTGKRFDRTYGLDEHEAGVVRYLARELLAGRSLVALAREMNERGEPLPSSSARKSRLGRPAQWQATTISLLVRRPANVAQVVHRKGTAEETRHPALWPPILTDEQYAAVSALFAGREAYGGGRSRPGKRAHLLTWGIAYCGVCGGILMAKQHSYTSKRTGATTVHWNYTCKDGGCVQRRAAHLDDFARDVLIERLSRDDALAWMAGDEDEARHAAEEVATLQRRLDEAADGFAEGTMTAAQIKRINARVVPDLQRATDRHAAAVRSLDIDLLKDLAGPEAAARWDALEVAQRRAVLDEVGLRIEVGRSSTSRKPRVGLDQSTVSIRFERVAT